MGSKTRKRKLVLHIISIAIVVCAAIAIFLTVFSGTQISSVYNKLVEETLNTAAIQMADEIQRMYEGEWNLDEDDVLWKGDHQFKGDFIGSLKTQTGLDYAIFYDNVRAITTVNGSPVGRKNADTLAPDEIYNTVVKNGKTYYRTNYTVAGELYSGAYAPVLDADGTIGGMTVAFRKTSDIKKDIRRIVILMIVLATCCVIVFSVIGFFLYKSSAHAMQNICDGIVKMAAGELNVEFSSDALNRPDELGTIAENSKLLRDELNTIVTDIKTQAHSVNESSADVSTTANDISQTADSVAEAVQEIATGATQQADEIQDSTESTMVISENIQMVTSNASELKDTADQMHINSQKSAEQMQRLQSTTEDMIAALDVISEKINATSDAVKVISSKVEAINSIASQTNLLALNASIEAARAGEAGRGFAVVAEEIGQLADNSAQTASEIREEMAILLSSSHSAVEHAGDVREATEEQKIVLAEAIDSIRELTTEIDSTVEGVNTIMTSAYACDESKGVVVDSMSSLSAISEENAAASEQTSASMEELSATVNTLANTADSLKEVSEALIEEISFFKN